MTEKAPDGLLNVHLVWTVNVLLNTRTQMTFISQCFKTYRREWRRKERARERGERKGECEGGRKRGKGESIVEGRLQEPHVPTFRLQGQLAFSACSSDTYIRHSAFFSGFKRNDRYQLPLFSKYWSTCLKKSISQVATITSGVDSDDCCP